MRRKFFTVQVFAMTVCFAMHLFFRMFGNMMNFPDSERNQKAQKQYQAPQLAICSRLDQVFFYKRPAKLNCFNQILVLLVLLTVQFVVE